MKKSIIIAVTLCFCALAVYAQLMSVPKGNILPDDPTSQWPAYSDTIEMKVGKTLTNIGQMNLLPKKDMGNYFLPVYIGVCEMRGIEEAKFGNESGRPMTYDLFTTIMDKSGLKVKSVVVSKLEGGTYYADLLIDANGKRLLFDSRPSDAINLAMRTNAPIYVTKKVWDEAKQPAE